ncbi:protease complex subunit PrcB family protein [Bacillus massilinigeriensis]|uniref:protease complex subunit PrcB family protein n=1 Tax=Bacillus massilionigeriensis TaxID=1805475 RepID=UPI00096B1992|nr:protease complex subunit PrcB family protein [Bacillus massilionigeriensis]
MRKICILSVFICIFLFSSVIVWAKEKDAESGNFNPTFTLVNEHSLSEIEKKFVEMAKTVEGVHHYGDLYVISQGAKPNSGYMLEYTEQLQKWEQLQIMVKSVEPKKGEMYSDVIVYPSIVGRLQLPAYTTLSVLDETTHRPFLKQKSLPFSFQKQMIITEKSKTWKIPLKKPITKKSLADYRITLEKLGKDSKTIPVRVTLERKNKILKIKPTHSFEYNSSYLLQIENKNSKEKKTIIPFEVKPKTIRLNDDFNHSLNGWIGGFSDLPINYDQEAYQLEFAHSIIPSKDIRLTKGLKLSGMNRSDDLFMFAKKKISKEDGLAPSTKYLLKMDVQFYTNVNPKQIGIGGAPGEAVYVKAGATTVEPKAIPHNSDLRMNIDKGEQASGGKDAVLMGNIAKESSSNDQYILKKLSLKKEMEVTTDKNGELWLIFGTDSGFEGRTTLYYQNVEVILSKK